MWIEPDGSSSQGKRFLAKSESHWEVAQKSTTRQGVRVITERHPWSRSVVVGFWFDVGSRHEPQALNGITHFLEHMVFKGTKKRSALEITRSLEAVGGEINAFTSREHTCFHTLTLKKDLWLSLDVLFDLSTHAIFKKDDLETERKVVHQEMQMAADQLEEYIFDLYLKEALQGSLGQPILGSEKTLLKMNRKVLCDYYRSHYRASRLIITVVGDIDHDEVVSFIEKRAADFARGGLNGSPRPSMKRSKSSYQMVRSVLHRPSEQVHLLFGFPSVSFKGPHRFESYIVNTLLGGGMTSRLYQVIRERRGWAYSVSSFLNAFTDLGLSMVYIGTGQEYLKPVVESVGRELRKLKTKGVKRSELNLYRNQVKGQILIGSEDIENRMNSLAVNEMVIGRYRSVDEVIQEIDAVTLESLHEYLHEYLKLDQVGLFLLGDVDEPKTKSWIRQIDFS